MISSIKSCMSVVTVLHCWTADNKKMIDIQNNNDSLSDDYKL